MSTITATSLYLVTVRYLTASVTAGTRSVTIAAANEEDATELGREEVLSSSPPPRVIIATTAIRMNEPAR